MNHGRPVPEDDIRRALLQELPESSKKNFLQLEKTSQYDNRFNDLCLEVITRDEDLQQTLGDEVIVINNVNTDHNS